MKRPAILIVLGAALAVTVVGGLIAFALTRPPFSVLVFGSGKGSPEYAHRWRQSFEDVPDPETAASKHPEVAVKRFPNGEWVFGVCDDSHRSPQGGTIVVRDSTGKVRAFFGHVCGPRFLHHNFNRRQSLKDFYAADEFKMFGFVEYRFP